MQLLGECDSRVVVGQLAARLAVLAGERNAVVDVEDAVGAAGRPDGGRGLDAVLLGVDLAVGEGAAAGEGGAGCLLVWGVSESHFSVFQSLGKEWMDGKERRGWRLTVLPASWEK
jgi:hypothetical protein